MKFSIFAVLLAASVFEAAPFAQDTNSPPPPKGRGWTAQPKTPKPKSPATESAPAPAAQFGLSATNVTTQIQEAGNPHGAQALGATPADAELSRRVLTAISTGTTGTQGTIASDALPAVQVSSTNGMVTLRGSTASVKDKELIGKKIRRLEGVKGVDNQLRPGWQR